MKLSTNLSGAKKLECVISFLTEHHLDTDGGYPHDWAALPPDWIVVAGLDGFKENNATKLEVYREPDLVAWFDRALELLGDEKDYGERVCFHYEPFGWCAKKCKCQGVAWDFTGAMHETDESGPVAEQVEWEEPDDA